MSNFHQNNPCCWDYDVCEYNELGSISKEEEHLRNQLRLLWEQHIYWTRLTIIGIADDSPDLAFTTKRLLRNANDFALAFKPFYGTKAAGEFGELIKDHLVIAANLVKAAKAGNKKAAADAEKLWYENADQIAYFLNRINCYWDLKEMTAMWHKHLALTKNEAVATLSGKYAESIALFDEIENQALMMADMFTNGIIAQFPAMFAC
ncbi:MAG: hypothetical protein H6Q73_3345 [Firmicutes bacterium]|nr:hypothetical protein [Bacillota bacterium]